MLRWTLALALTASMILAGCLGPDVDPGDLPGDGMELKFLARGTPLWNNPQDFPHPAYGWPTLTNPPSGADIPEWWRPIPAATLPGTISGMEHFAKSDNALPAGAGFAAFGSLISMPTWGPTTHIIDISDPGSPKVLSTIEEATRGAVMIPFPDGRLITVYATSDDLLVYDITDPRNPEFLTGLLDDSRGSHKVGVVPGTPIVYNAASTGGGVPDALLGEPTGYTDIWDLSDPENPVKVQDFANGYGCHHIYFYNDPARDLYRTYCAGIQMTQIWDTTDPRDPVVIAEISMPLGDPFPPLAPSPAMLSHFSIVNQDATVLVVGDETGGGAAPGCDVYLNALGKTISGPIGNLWFYDITDETNPVLKGWMSPTHHYPTNPPVNEDGVLEQGGFGAAGCTAHHGRLVPDPEGRDLLAMAFYGAGVVLVDFTDAANPVIVDQWNDNTNTWEVWYYNGYLFTGDLNRGLDVLTLK